VFIIGGESIFRQFLPWCATADITAVDYRYDGDSFLPALDRDPSWKLLHESEEETYFDLPFTFQRYIRIRADRIR
jgi:dihydrofolate reductase